MFILISSIKEIENGLIPTLLVHDVLVYLLKRIWKSARN